MTITREDILKMANLSRLEFTPAEMEKFGKELDDIVGYVSSLAKVDTENVPPMTSVVQNAPTVERPDKATEENKREAYLESAPASEMGFYVVPKVIE